VHGVDPAHPPRAVTEWRPTETRTEATSRGNDRHGQVTQHPSKSVCPRQRSIHSRPPACVPVRRSGSALPLSAGEGAWTPSNETETETISRLGRLSVPDQVGGLKQVGPSYKGVRPNRSQISQSHLALAHAVTARSKVLSATKEYYASPVFENYQLAGRRKTGD
jgi:hypothetical protein